LKEEPEKKTGGGGKKKIASMVGGMLTIRQWNCGQWKVI